MRSGDPAALAEAVGHYRTRLYRYLLRLVRDQASADDLFQQTWLHVVRQLHRYDAARSFDTWLFAIAHNAAMDLLRRRPGESLEDREFSLPARGPDALSTVLSGERAAILAAAPRVLPALRRQCPARLPNLPPHRPDRLDALCLVRKSAVGVKPQSEPRPWYPLGPERLN